MHRSKLFKIFLLLWVYPRLNELSTETKNMNSFHTFKRMLLVFYKGGGIENTWNTHLFIKIKFEFICLIFLRISVCNELDKVKFNWTCFVDVNGVEDKWTYSQFRSCVKVRAVFQGKRSKCCTSTMTWPPSVSHCLHHLNLFKAFGSIETYVRICLFRLWCSVECRRGGNIS